MMQRLDKTLSKELNISRSEAKQLIKKGSVKVNGALASSDSKCAEDDVISVNGKEIKQNEFVYIMLNKPQGAVSATEDKSEKTVIDLLPEEMRRKGLFPAGRLDKDTTGFLLLTDDGEFAHSILSPKKHIDKIYTARLDKPINEDIINDFESGMQLGDSLLQSAGLETINGDNTFVKITLREGIYHQIKRMFKKYGITVIELRRIAMGSLYLDSSLKEGECRYITFEELGKIRPSK